MNVVLLVDGKKIGLNEFVKKMMSGTIVGAVSSLRDVKKNWKEIRVEVTRQK